MARKGISVSFTGNHSAGALCLITPELRFSTLGPQENPQESTEPHDAGKR